MSKILSLIAAIACVFLFAGAMLADDAAAPAAAPAVTTGQPQTAPKQHPKTSIISGAVVSVDAAARQIIVKNSEGKMNDVTFDVSEKTNIRKAGKDITLSDIAAGDKIIVAFIHKDDKRIATSIKIRVPKAKTAGDAPVAPPTPQ